MVFDASALIALLRDEVGADFVEELFFDADVPRYIHSINLIEVFVYFVRHNNVLVAQQTLADVRTLGIIERDDLDDEFCEDVGTLKGEHHIALGDCFGLALARRLNVDFVTSDWGEIGKLKDAEVCGVTFIR